MLVICIPGQDTALTVRNAMLGGRRAGIATVLGVAAGQPAWTVATAAGLAVLTVAWLAGYTFAVERMRRVLGRRAVRTALAGLGLRLSVEAIG